jgi:hypothetical protein
MNKLLVIIIIIILLLFFFNTYNESFVSNLTIIDPYSVYLFADTSKKEEWWNDTHARELYYYRDYVPQFLLTQK